MIPKAAIREEINLMILEEVTKEKKLMTPENSLSPKNNQNNIKAVEEDQKNHRNISLNLKRKKINGKNHLKRKRKRKSQK